VTLIYYIIPNRFRWIWIIISSIIFYISFIPIYIYLIIGLVVINYFSAIHLYKLNDINKTRYLIKVIIINIIILVTFKYIDFFQGVFNSIIFKWHILSVNESAHRWVIPLGLSFIIFTILSYLIEVKRNKISPERHFGIFCAYMIFFPKIAQGPIERPQNLIQQFHLSHKFDFAQTIDGLKLMLWGFFKKIVVADRLALFVDSVFNNYENHNGTTLALATVFYSIQIYADFSGYTDIALGSAKILGFKLTQNFNRPLFSTSIKDFWDRWHITFSTWLRDYLFLPLAFYFSNKLKKDIYFKITSEKWIYLFAVTITFSIAGIWHGEGLNYLIWGLLFGIYLTCSNWANRLKIEIRKKLHLSKKSLFVKISKIFITFLLVSLAWIFFRSPNLSTACIILKKIFTQPGPIFIGEWQKILYSFFAIIFLLSIEINKEFIGSGELPFKFNCWLKDQIAYVILIVIILLMGVFDGSQFIYFQF